MQERFSRFLSFPEIFLIKLNKKIFLLIILLFSVGNIAGQSQENPKEAEFLIKEMIFFIEKRDLSGIQMQMERLKESPLQVEAEELILKAVRQAVLNKDFDYALALTGIILLVNIDHVQAQELYVSISQEKRQEELRLLREQEEKKRKEEEAKKAEEERIKKEEQERNKKQEEALKKAEEERIRKITTVGMENFSFLLEAYPLGFFRNQSDFAENLNPESSIDFAYFASGGAAIGFSHPFFNASLGARYGKTFLTPEESFNHFYFLFTAGTPLTGIPLSLNAGYGIFYYSHPERIPQASLYYNIHSILLGVSLEEWSVFEKFYFTVKILWMTISLQDNLDDSWMAVLTMRYELMNWNEKKSSLFLLSNTEIKKYLYQRKSEWDFTSSFGVGLWFK